MGGGEIEEEKQGNGKLVYFVLLYYFSIHALFKLNKFRVCFFRFCVFIDFHVGMIHTVQCKLTDFVATVLSAY